ELAERVQMFRILVTVGEARVPEALRAELGEWVAAGGAWLSMGGLCGMGDLLGAAYREPGLPLWGGALGVLGEGYLAPLEHGHPALAGITRPLHFFGGIAVVSAGAPLLSAALDAH